VTGSVIVVAVGIAAGVSVALGDAAGVLDVALGFDVEHAVATKASTPISAQAETRRRPI